MCMYILFILYILHMFTKEELIQTFWYFQASNKVTTLIVTNGKGRPSG